MPELRCSGCRGNLPPEDVNVEFITCIYCRAANKNPNFRVIPESAPPPVQQQPINQNVQPTMRQPTTDTQRSEDAEFFVSTFMSLLAGGAWGAHRRGRRSRRRRRGCGCGGCLMVIILIFLVFALLAAFVFRVEIAEIIYRVTGYQLLP